MGRAAIHPTQVPVIAAVFLLDPDELRDAQALLTAFGHGVDVGRGVVVLPDGRMVDAAMVRLARRTLDLAAGYRYRSGRREVTEGSPNSPTDAAELVVVFVTCQLGLRPAPRCSSTNRHQRTSLRVGFNDW